MQPNTPFKTYLKFDIKLSFYLTISFILMTIVGTLTHELGHYTTAKLLGHEAHINYKSAFHYNNEIQDYLRSTYNLYSNEIENGIDFPEKNKYEKAVNKLKTDNFWIILSGPMQTMLTGTIGFILLLTYRDKFINANNISILGWGLIFTTLFWLRQLTNLFMAIVGLLKNGEPSLNGDEMRLAWYLNINIWTIQILTGLISICILIFVLKIIPKTKLLTFLLSGLIGGISGYYVWLIKFGKIIMP